MTTSSRVVLKPGDTIGIVGGGQLGRMLAMAAARPDFRGATVVDGTGADRYRADVLVRDGLIDRVGRDLTAHQKVNADGLVLAPGFIDMHSHSDLRLLVEPEHPSRVTQGVTCEVLGQDGLSYAPVDERTLPALVPFVGDDRVVWGSDYPHHDATFPGAVDALRATIAPCATATQAKVLGLNARHLYRLPSRRPAPAGRHRPVAAAPARRRAGTPPAACRLVQPRR